MEKLLKILRNFFKGEGEEDIVLPNKSESDISSGVKQASKINQPKKTTIPKKVTIKKKLTDIEKDFLKKIDKQNLKKINPKIRKKFEQEFGVLSEKLQEFITNGYLAMGKLEAKLNYKYTLPELKKELKNNKLSVQGSKNQLLERLIKNSKKTLLSRSVKGIKVYCLTEEGIKRINSIK